MPEIAISRFTGFAGLYNAVRPQAPYRASDILLSLSGRRKVDVVVDLGSGTGLSTRMWKGRAHRVYGIEPNDDMRAVAVRSNPGVEFIKASSYATTLPDSSADIVVCSQSFHWMEPIASLREIDRVLLPGGLFAILDCDWPVTAGIEAELAYERLFSAVDALRVKYANALPVEDKRPKGRHIDNVRASGYFDYVKEIPFEAVERCDAARFVGIALSQGQLQTLLKNGVSEIDPEIEAFTRAVTADFSRARRMSVGYRMIVARKRR